MRTNLSWLMRIEPTRITYGAQGAGGLNADGLRRRAQLVEVLVFLFLIVPSMCFSFLVVRTGNLGFVVTALATIFRDLALVSLVAFFLWRNGEAADRIGWNFRGGLRDVVSASFLFVPLFFGSSCLDRLLLSVGFSAPATATPKFLRARGPTEFALAFVLVVVVAITEEVIFRGYLILRLRAVTRSTAAAVVLSSVIFSLGHGYEGTAGVVTVGFMGVAFALVYIWRRSLVAPILMHFLQDCLTIVVIPMLRYK
jgi:membrane protease YdiL (CAAX protease family)